MKIADLRSNKGSRKKKKLVGRGPGSGHGKTSCKGSKGQMSRASSRRRPGFEGGQNPLMKRLPKRGFTSKFRKDYSLVNLGSLNLFEENSTVTPQLLKEKNLIKSLNCDVKILGDGELKKVLTIQAHRFSKSAQEKIEKAGGKAIAISGEEEKPKEQEAPKKSAAPNKPAAAKPVKSEK